MSELDRGWVCFSPSVTKLTRRRMAVPELAILQLQIIAREKKCWLLARGEIV